MKTTIASLLTTFAFAAAMHGAEVTTKLTDVHVCCQSCVTGVQKALVDVKGIVAVASKDDETVTLTAADAATVQKAADALVAAGYFGKSSNADIKIVSTTGAKGQTVKTLKVEGVHLCCAKCVSTVDETLMKVAGVKAQDAKRGAKTFTVTGDFNDKEVFTALQKAGLTGKVAKE